MRISDWSSDVCSSDLAVGWPPGGAVRPAGAQVPRLGTDVLAAGLHLPCDAADHPRAGAVLRHRPARPRVVRLCLPAAGVDGRVPVDGALDRGRPRQAGEARRPPLGGADGPSQGGPDPAVACVRRVGGVYLRWLFTPAPTGG